MNIDFYLHGTPLGQDVYSTCKTEDLYVLSFYGMNLEDSSMAVETKVFNNTINCYYTYYRNHIYNIHQKKGYCAITLKSNCFINCIKIIYHILDICFEQHILGTYISSGKHKQFTVDSIQSKESTFFDCLASLLSQTLKKENVSHKLDDSFIANARPQLVVHPSNINISEILTTY